MLAEREGYFGRFGGQFVPETLMAALHELEAAYRHAREDPTFREEYEEATNLGRESIRTITRISSLDVDYKDDIFGNIYSIIGNSYFELDDIKASIFWHSKDLKFSRKR